MRLKLVSDFSDYYDICFDEDGLEFQRITTDGPPRLEMFKILNGLGLLTPLYGNYNYFVDKGYQENDLVVVHIEDKHCGEGKFLKKFGELSPKERNCLLVKYIAPEVRYVQSSVKSQSLRYLFIGRRCFSYNYVSTTDWRSNCGEGGIINRRMVYPCPGWRDKVKYPLFAIDFVEKGSDKYAIDFNIAPGIFGTGINKFISSAEIVLQIKNWIENEGT